MSDDRNYALEYRMEQQRCIEPEVKEMKFEVGKKYKRLGLANTFTCCGLDILRYPIIQDINSKELFRVLPECYQYYSEYKEPVVHKIYVHIMKHKKNGSIQCVAGTTFYQKAPIWPDYDHLGTQEISFEEKPE
jgi:hypothetical protein